MLESVEVRITADEAEIIVRPRFYTLSAPSARAAWDAVVKAAARRGYQLVQAVEPDIDPDLCMERDAEGVEYHYLVPANQPAAIFTR